MAAEPRNACSALRDLRRIARDVVGQSGRGRAVELMLRLRRACEMLAEHPHAGREVDHLSFRLRAFTMQPHVIFDRLEADGVAVVRVIYGTRHVESALAQDD